MQRPRINSKPPSRLDPTFENGYELAVADLDLGDGKSAAKIFSEMLTSFGDTAAIHMYFGQAYGRSDFQDDAVAEFQKAIAKDDRLPGVHYSLAAAYLSTSGSSKLPEAERELKTRDRDLAHQRGGVCSSRPSAGAAA